MEKLLEQKNVTVIKNKLKDGGNHNCHNGKIIIIFYSYYNIKQTRNNQM